jgi:hypothetical protein
MYDQKEWTIMFYFASDNPLAPGIVSQLKAIKDAGFHPKANVVTRFDPHTVGTPTHIFDVNNVEKLKHHGGHNIGFQSNDPFVRSLLEDKLWRNQKTRCPTIKVRDKYQGLLRERHGIEYHPPVPPNGRSRQTFLNEELPQEPSPRESLETFLDFCRNKYPARNYMLFILGHGIVVGNDIFLYDEHAAEKSLTLHDLGEVLTTFRDDVKPEGSEFQLVSFHSCSVSSLEVAYELQGTANYMLATQGPAFVGSWPYRQILVRIFNDLLHCGDQINVRKMIVKIFYYCLYNSTDFLMAGYSFDLCLINLNKVDDIKAPLKRLAVALTKALVDRDLLAREFIQLSHLKSQSYWQERYTDIYDFCVCFRRLCDEYVARYQRAYKGQFDKQANGPFTLDTICEIYEACEGVMKQLKPEDHEPEENDRMEGEDKCRGPLILRSKFAGPEYQYSHGLSVFFPWTEPQSDDPIWSRPEYDPPFVGQYERYKFEESCWRSFLLKYFEETMRKSRNQEGEGLAKYRARKPTDVCEEDPKEAWVHLLEDMISLVYDDEGQLSGSNALEGPKTDPRDPTGDACSCPSIKNYPRDTRASYEKGSQAPNAEQSVPISETFVRTLELGNG